MMRISTKSPVNLLTLSRAWNHSADFDTYKKKGHFALFLLEAMSRSPLPSFTYRGQRHPLQKKRSWYGDFDKTLRAYFRTHKTEILKGSKMVDCKEARLFPTQLKRLIESFGDYKLPCTQIVLAPNVFGAPGEGYGPLVGDTAYAIFTPNPKKDQTWLMIHEICHGLLLPIFHSAKIKKQIQKSHSKYKTWSTATFRKYYPKWEWMIEEYMIHAIEQRVTGSSVEEKESWGMNRMQWFINSWEKFQQQLKMDKKRSVEDWVTDVLQKLAKSSNP